MSRRDTDPNRGNRKIPLATVSAADLLGLNDETAPAEDPRGGEARCKGTIWPSSSDRWIPCPGVIRNSQCSAYGWQHASANTAPPAAGRGDTDSGGEAWRPVCGCEQGMGHMDRGCHSYGLCHAQSAERAARPAGDRAQPTEELREAVMEQTARWLLDAFGMGLDWDTEATPELREIFMRRAGQLLAGPLAALLDAQAAVERVRKLRHVWTRDGSEVVPSANLRRALDGTT